MILILLLIVQMWFYLEGFHDAPNFLKAAEQTTQKKPVILLKANRGASGI